MSLISFKMNDQQLRWGWGCPHGVIDNVLDYKFKLSVAFTFRLIPIGKV